MGSRSSQTEPPKHTYQMYVDHEHRSLQEIKTYAEIIDHLGYAPIIFVIPKEQYGLLYFFRQQVEDFCGHYEIIRKQLEKLNPGYPLVQAFFDKATGHVKMAIFEGSPKYSSTEYFNVDPQKPIIVDINQLTNTPGEKYNTHTFYSS